MILCLDGVYREYEGNRIKLSLETIMADAEYLEIYIQGAKSVVIDRLKEFVARQMVELEWYI